jgi:hypothetical protein
LVKAHVTDLGDIPKHIVMSENDGFQGETWSIQCEIIHQDLLGAQPQLMAPLICQSPLLTSLDLGS